MAKSAAINNKNGCGTAEVWYREFCKYFISFIISKKIRKKTYLLHCTSNQVGTDHKLHFQPKNQARVKLAEINNKNACGTAEVWCRKLGSVSYHWYYHIRSGKRQLCSFVPPTKPAQTISSIFSPKNPVIAKLAAINNQNGCGMAEVWCIQFPKYLISLIISYKVRKICIFAPLYRQPSQHWP